MTMGKSLHHSQKMSIKPSGCLQLSYVRMNGTRVCNQEILPDLTECNLVQLRQIERGTAASLIIYCSLFAPPSKGHWICRLFRNWWSCCWHVHCYFPHLHASVMASQNRLLMQQSTEAGRHCLSWRSWQLHWSLIPQNPGAHLHQGCWMHCSLKWLLYLCQFQDATMSFTTKRSFNIDHFLAQEGIVPLKRTSHPSNIKLDPQQACG